MNRFPNRGRRSPPDSPKRALGIDSMELSRNIRVDTVARLVSTPPIAIAASAPVAEAITAMREGNVGCLLVTDRGRLVGIFTERDLLTRILGRGRELSTTVRAVMTPDPISVGPNDPVRTAIRRMQRGGYRHLPVVDADGRPLGIVSARRVVHYLVEHFPAVVFNQPPDGNPLPEKPEGA